MAIRVADRANTRAESGGAVQLGNRGDTLLLLDPGGSTIDKVAYTANQIRPGRTICVGR